MFTLLYVLARRRRPVRLLKYPDRASLLRPRGLQRASRQPTAGAGTGFRRLSGRCHITPSGDWASSNPTFTLSRGSPGTPPHTPGHVPPVSWHAIFPYVLSDSGQPLDPEISPLIPARCSGDITVHLMAHRLLRALCRHRARTRQAIPRSSLLYVVSVT
jgi:hypothetical protein